MTNQLCFELPEQQIKLIQTDFDCFTVIYGKQITRNLGYVQAAHQLGCVVMHAAACDGRLDSDTREQSQDDEPYFETPVSA
jgi:hypothetical protein